MYNGILTYEKNKEKKSDCFDRIITEEFWMVVCVGSYRSISDQITESPFISSTGSDTAMYANFDAADEEAKAMAIKNPGKQYFVTKSIGYYLSKIDPKWTPTKAKKK